MDPVAVAAIASKGFMQLLTPENFRDFTFVNPAMMHLSMNPDYFKGTLLEAEAERLLETFARVSREKQP